MEIKPGIYRCSFGYGELELTAEAVSQLNSREQLETLRRKAANIIFECEGGVNIYQCKCPIGYLTDDIWSELKHLGSS